VVETVGGAAAVSHVLEQAGDVAVESCTRTAATDWYFASGTTIDESQLDLSLFNPFGDDAIVDVSFVTDAGAQEPAGLQALVVPRRSRVTIPVQDAVLRQARVAAHVHARSGRLVAEQTQTFDDVDVGDGTRRGVALSLGATSADRVWRIPAGSTRDDGRVQLALANFSRHEADVDVKTILVGGDDLPAEDVRVPAQGVVVVDVTARVPLDTDVAVTATARGADGRGVPVVAELLTTSTPASGRGAVGGTLGSTVVARRWVLPVPTVEGDTTVTVFNPGSEPVTAELLAAADVDRRIGPTSESELALAPGTAKRVRIAVSGARPVPVVVTADHPVVVGYTVAGADGTAISTAIPDLVAGR